MKSSLYSSVDKVVENEIDFDSSVEKIVEAEGDFDSEAKYEQDTVSPFNSLTSRVLTVFSLSQ